MTEYDSSGYGAAGLFWRVITRKKKKKVGKP